MLCNDDYDYDDTYLLQVRKCMIYRRNRCIGAIMYLELPLPKAYSNALFAEPAVCDAEGGISKTEWK